MLNIKISPICHPSLPRILNKDLSGIDYKSLKQALLAVAGALESMHKLGFVHRDVRWDNVMFDTGSGKFLVIDYEHSGPKDVFVNSAVRGYPDEIAKGAQTNKAKNGAKVYSCATDMYMVGLLLEYLDTSCGLNEPYAQLMDDLLQNDETKRPTATHLKELLQNTDF